MQSVKNTDQHLERSFEERLKRVEDAGDNFRKVMERWNDRLALEGSSYWELYFCGRVALVLDCQLAFQMKRRGGLVPERDAPVVDRHLHAFLVLKKYSPENHTLQGWDDKLVLIHNVEIVESPEGGIPSLVGFYFIPNKITNSLSRLLFKSTVDYGYKFFPRLEDWKLCMFAGVPVLAENCLTEKNIKSTTQVMNGVSNDQGGPISWELASVPLDPQKVYPNLFIDKERIEVRIPKAADQILQVNDVLIGPFNL